MEVIESVYHGIDEFFNRKEEPDFSLLDMLGLGAYEHGTTEHEDRFFESKDPRDLVWYQPVRTEATDAEWASVASKIKASGVFMGGDVITSLIKLPEDDVLAGENPENVFPIIEESFQWSYLNNPNNPN